MDRRDYFNHYGPLLPEHKLDLKSGIISFVLENDDGEEVEYKLPVKMEVCGTCDGKGSHVNPSIDSHGLSREDFDEDPDFEEGYRSGVYDVTCYECKGNNVVPEIDEESADPKVLKILRKWQKDESDYRKECESERRFCGGW